MLALAAPQAMAIQGVRSAQVPDRAPVITSRGQSYSTWSAFTQSSQFRNLGLRCASPDFDPSHFSTAMLAPSDCAYGSTTVKPEYDPGVIYTIPVVVHVIQKSNGQGYISPAKVQSQIDVLNEDFLAIAGSDGAPGTDSAIQFELASVDPSGSPTTGITYSTNDTWYGDGGGYWNSLAWDTKNYLNIYTNSASGNLGYVPGFPQGGNLVGSKSDRVVVLWSSFGQNGPIGPPYNKGRTTTHEVGHYLGLYHTFQGGCASSACYTSGDTVCDTNRESSPTYGCSANKSSCGSSDPIHNYMDYSDDLCMWEFTPEQVNRMRCTLENWRPDLAVPNLGPGPGTPVCLGDGSGASCPCGNAGAGGEGCANSTGKGAVLTAAGSSSGALLTASGIPSVSNDTLSLTASQVPIAPGFFMAGTLTPGGMDGEIFQNGLRCINPNQRLQKLNNGGTIPLPSAPSISMLTSAAPGDTQYFQYWYRNGTGLCSAGINSTNALEVTWGL